MPQDSNCLSYCPDCSLFLVITKTCFKHALGMLVLLALDEVCPLCNDSTQGT